MPWSETTPMKERLRFWLDYQRGLFDFTTLCAIYRISRKTGYKLIDRILAKGIDAALADRSRTPHTCPHRTPDTIAEAVLAVRRRHPRWGARKLVAYLQTRQPETRWPAPSTVGMLLTQAGLVVPRRRRPHPGHPGRGTTAMDAPNTVWTADFKGHFKTRDGQYCYPLTIVDGFSRYLLACRALRSTAHEGVSAVFLQLFREYGLPGVIRTDNGVPFASQALHRLSRLHVWWIKLGIQPELNEPSHPEQNGRHERMHRDLKAEATRPPAASARGQQRLFDRFRQEYNDLRPHEALAQQTPATQYRPSVCPYSDTLSAPQYPAHFEVRRVSHNGGIRWNRDWVNVTHVLAEESIGLEEIDDGIWDVYFASVLLGRFDERELRLYGAYPENRSL